MGSQSTLLHGCRHFPLKLHDLRVHWTEPLLGFTRCACCRVANLPKKHSWNLQAIMSFKLASYNKCHILSGYFHDTFTTIKSLSLASWQLGQRSPANHGRALPGTGLLVEGRSWMDRSPRLFRSRGPGDCLIPTHRSQHRSQHRSRCRFRSFRSHNLVVPVGPRQSYHC